MVDENIWYGVNKSDEFSSLKPTFCLCKMMVGVDDISFLGVSAYFSFVNCSFREGMASDKSLRMA